MGKTSNQIDATMNIELTLEETRVLGSLMEKAVTTPDHYPLTLNALTNACNQKSSRDPVMALDPGVVQRTARQLDDRHLVSRNENFKSGVEKYAQRLCNTHLGELQFSEAEYAIVCVLLLRGPQTPGELRTRCNRLHPFADNQEVTDALLGLMQREGDPIVARLPRTPGRLDSEYAHLFSGEIESVPVEADVTTRAPRDSRTSRLESRVSELERALTELAEKLGETIDLPAASDDGEDLGE
jgi:hypothetical protein|tara:strand:- start:3103 stop:3825 length:723 start_codon:yes stop_codon:yes gene_type:complete